MVTNKNLKEGWLSVKWNAFEHTNKELSYISEYSKSIGKYVLLLTDYEYQTNLHKTNQ